MYLLTSENKILRLTINSKTEFIYRPNAMIGRIPFNLEHLLYLSSIIYSTI